MTDPIRDWLDDPEAAGLVGEYPGCEGQGEYYLCYLISERYPKAIAALTAVLDIHEPETIAVHEGYGAERWCPSCREHSPCDTAKAIREALGVES